MKFWNKKNSKSYKDISDLQPDIEALDYHILHFEDFTNSFDKNVYKFYNKWLVFFRGILDTLGSRLGIFMIVVFSSFLLFIKNQSLDDQNVLGIIDVDSLELSVLKLEGDNFSIKKANTEFWTIADKKTIIQVGDTITTEDNVRMSITSTDKSEIFLDYNSSIKIFKYSENEASIELIKGKAYFFSKKDEENFIIQKGTNVSIYASSSQFYIDSSDNFNELIVVDGSVRVVTPSSVDYIYEADRAMISSSAGSIIKEKVNNSIFENDFIIWCIGNRTILNSMFPRPEVQIETPGDETRIDKDKIRITGKIKTDVSIVQIEVNNSIFNVEELPLENYNPDSNMFSIDVDLLKDGENKILIAAIDSNKQTGEDYIFIYKNQNPATNSSSTKSPEVSPTITSTPKVSPTVTSTISKITPTNTIAPTATKKSATSTPKPTVKKTATPTPTPTFTPTSTPSPTPTSTPTSTPTLTPTPTLVSTEVPSPTPTEVLPTPIPTI